MFLGTNTLRAKATFSLCEQACGKSFLQLRLKAKDVQNCGGGYVKVGGRGVVCYTAVFSVVTQRWGGALRDDSKNGCVAD